MVNNNSNVIIVGPLPSIPGGVSVYVKTLLGSDLKSHFNFFYLRTGTTKGVVLRDYFTTVIYYNILHFFGYFKLILEKDIHIVHIHTSSWGGFWRFCFYILISKIFGVRTVLHVHGAEFKMFFRNSGKLGQITIKNFIESCDQIIVLSNSWKSFFDSIAPNSKLSVVPVTVSLPNLKDNEVVNKHFVKIMFLGGLVRRKCLFELINVSKKLLGEYRDIKIFIGGIPSLSEMDIVSSLNEMADNPKFSDNFRFQMNISEQEKDVLYRSSDIFVLQSVNEGMPLTLLEAMSYSLPVITTPVGAIPEFIKEPDNGFLVPPNDESELYTKIKNLIHNPVLRETMGKNNRLKIKENYTNSVMVDKVREVYKNL